MAMNSFKRMIMMANQIDDKPSLPKEYVQLEYLESLPEPTYGRCIIDTGIEPSNTRVIMKAQGTACNTAYMSPIGYYNDYAGCAVFCYKDNKGWGLYSTDNSCTNIPYTDIAEIDVVFKTTPIHSILGTINNVPVNYTRSSKLGISTLKLFHCVGILSDYSNKNYGFIGKIFYCRIEDVDSGIVLGEYIPALRIADLKPGMYDLVTRQFFTNQGTGEFAFPDNIPDTQKPYLCFEALEDDFSVCLGGDFHEHVCQYSFDRKDWFDLPARTYTPAIGILQKVYFRANLTPVTINATKPNEIKSIGYFSTTKKCRLSGNPTSMLHGMDWALGNFNTSVPNYGLSNLFINTMSVSVSKGFFSFTSVVTRACYNMFSSNKYLEGSIYITKAAGTSSTGSVGVFMGAFGGCKLDSVFIETNESAWQTYQNAFEYSLIKTLNLPATFIHPSMYYATCKNCTYLEKVFINGRKLNVSTTTTYINHLTNAFLNCSRLSTVTYLVTNPFDKKYTNNWLKGVAEEGTIILNKNITWNPEDYRNGNIDNIEGSATLGETITWGIPAGWEVKYCDPDNPDDVRDNKEDF